VHHAADRGRRAHDRAVELERLHDDAGPREARDASRAPHGAASVRATPPRRERTV
jgi:hypothetical protein